MPVNELEGAYFDECFLSLLVVVLGGHAISKYDVYDYVLLGPSKRIGLTSFRTLDCVLAGLRLLLSMRENSAYERIGVLTIW